MNRARVITSTVLLIILIFVLTLSGCKKSPEIKKEITISVAASLKEPLNEIVEAFEKDRGIKVNLNLGGSGTLQKQIEEGAEVDLFISAAYENMKKLDNKGLIEENSIMNLLGNSLVIIAHKSNEKIDSIAGLINKNIIFALGETKTVPAGIYGKQSLEKLEAWNLLQSKIVYAKDVKQVLEYVEKGEAQAGIVYKSDAINLKNSYIVQTIPESTHEEIVYPIGKIKGSNKKEEVNEFIKYITNSQSDEIFIKYKFKVLN